MSTLAQRAGVVAVVLAAMALGRVVTDVATAQPPNDPFVRTGELGDTVAMEYAEVTVTDVRSAAELETDFARVAAVERFLLVDVELTSTREPILLGGVYLVDAEGRRFVSDTRTGCAADLRPATGLAWRATYCFEVPRDSLEGMHVVVARSDHGTDGAEQRRDEVADVDLGIDAHLADELWETDELVTVEGAGPA